MLENELEDDSNDRLEDRLEHRLEGMYFMVGSKDVLEEWLEDHWRLA